MRKSTSLACGLVIALFTMVEGSAAANMQSVASGLQFDKLPAPSTTHAIDPSHFVYIPVIGPWLDLGRLGRVPESLLLDGVCQDVVTLVFVAGAFSHGEPTARPAPWRLLPWFPRSGGGGISLHASF